MKLKMKQQFINLYMLYLLLYYYDEIKVKFSEKEYCIDGLVMSKEDIASQIEF